MTETAQPTAALGSGPGFRPTLQSMVPPDRMRYVRLVLMSVYLVGYLWWLRDRGLIIDRISVAISLFIFLACAFLGKPLLTWLILLLDAAVYALMWYLYEITRGGADGGPRGKPYFPLQVDSVRNIDRFLFFGNDPNVVVQRWLVKPTVQWYEWIFSTTYFTHFVFPIVCMAVLWVVSHRQWGRFMRRFATLMLIACVMFILLPTAPPWMAASNGQRGFEVLPPLRRLTGRGFVDLGFKGFVKNWVKGQDWANEVAAMPSLHASYALIMPAFFFPWIRSRRVKAALLLFPAVMLFSLVFFGEHWVIDGLVGWAIVGFAFWLWNRIERGVRARRAGRARTAMAALHSTPGIQAVS